MTTKTTYNARGFLVYNRKTKQEIEVSTFALAAGAVGLSVSGIQRRVNHGLQDCGEYLVKRVEDPTPWRIKGEDASMAVPHVPVARERTDYSQMKVRCLDLQTGLETVYSGFSHAAEAKGMPYPSVRQSAVNYRLKGRVGIIDTRWVFRLEDDPFPKLEEARNQANPRHLKRYHVLLRVLPYGLVVHYDTPVKCAAATGLPVDEIKTVVRRGRQKTSKPHYLVKAKIDETPWLG